MNKTFCEICRKDVDFKVEIAIIKSKVKDKDYEYCGLKGVCWECGSEVYVPEIEEENLKIFNREVKRNEK